MKRKLLEFLILVDPKWSDRYETWGVEFYTVFGDWSLLQILFS